MNEPRGISRRSFVPAPRAQRWRSAPACRCRLRRLRADRAQARQRRRRGGRAGRPDRRLRARPQGLGGDGARGARPRRRALPHVPPRARLRPGGRGGRRVHRRLARRSARLRGRLRPRARRPARRSRTTGSARPSTSTASASTTSSWPTTRCRRRSTASRSRSTATPPRSTWPTPRAPAPGWTPARWPTCSTSWPRPRRPRARRGRPARRVHGVEADDLSLLFHVVAERPGADLADEDVERYRIRGGNDRLPNAFADRLRRLAGAALPGRARSQARQSRVRVVVGGRDGSTPTSA